MKNKLRTNIKYINSKILQCTLAISIVLGTFSCNDFLDVIPDNMSNLDLIFSTKEDAEHYLGTLYGLGPQPGLVANILFTGADDVWTYDFEGHVGYQYPFRIALGMQNTSLPEWDAWDGKRGVFSMYKGIRECNIFLEQIENPEKVRELDAYTRKRWIAEAKFIKAYFHFVLFRMYGPIPITDVNIPVSASPEETQVKREPVDEVVNYMAELLLEASEDLPLSITNRAEELGRATKGAALALRAKILVTAASDLFNGNPDYANFVDNDGTDLFSTERDENKWKIAAEACKLALEALPDATLYIFDEKEKDELSETKQYQMNLRGAITERFNDEVIWGLPSTKRNQSAEMQVRVLPPFIDPRVKSTYSYDGGYLSPTLAIVDRFYSKNGVPLEEDKEWDSKWSYANRYKIEVADESQKYNIQTGYTTSKVNFDRENRFYASLLFDGALAYMKNCNSEENAFPIQAKAGQRNSGSYAMTGYYILKLTNWNFTQTESQKGGDDYDVNYSTIGGHWYHWPEMRLADLYLLYAEALTETGQLDEAIKYVDMVRTRSGLKGVKESWTKYSSNPNKFATKDGLREIVHQEREIELAFEGSRIWDMRRWKKAGMTQNKDVLGWNLKGRGAESYYRPTVLHNQKFITPRDYLWPISISALQNNPNLVQNPGWK